MRTSSNPAFIRTTPHVAFRLLNRAPGPRPEMTHGLSGRARGAHLLGVEHAADEGLAIVGGEPARPHVLERTKSVRPSGCCVARASSSVR